MSTPDLDPRTLGLDADVLSFEAEDGRYGVELSHHRGGIWLVQEHGWADDKAGVELVALFVRLLEAVERQGPHARVYLCSDYRDYRGSSNATRKAMLREVVMRDSLGAVAFWGAGFVTRSVAMLLNVALPRLSARPFHTQEQALAFLEGLDQPAPEPVDAPGEREGESLDSAVLASFLLRNSEVVRMVQVGGRERRVVRPPEWCWRAPDGAAALSFSLVDDEVLLGQAHGPVSTVDVPVRRALVDRVLGELGLRRVSLVLDLRAQESLSAAVSLGRVAFFRERNHRLLNLVLVGDEGLLVDVDPMLLLGNAPLGVRPVFPDLDQALVALDRARTERQRSAEHLELPADRGELEAQARQLHRSLREHRLALERLFSFVGRVSWDESYLKDDLVVPSDVTAANPYWSLYGALHMMQHDMLEVLRDREARNRELAQAREQAESANRAKSQFLGTVSHELRTPLNAIFGMTDLLRGGGLEGDQLRRVAGIEAASRQLARLVGDLLDITRIEEGVLGLRPEPFELEASVQQLCDRWSPMAGAKGLSLQRQIHPALPVRVHCDGGRLLQVLTNLVDNAIKFTDQGWVRLAVQPCAGGVSFEVQDSGCGIAPDDLPFVFERFERGATGRTDVLPGVGLGLTICQQLVSLMGGEITVTSELGRGTRFAFSLPLAVLAAESSTPAPQELSSEEPYAARPEFSDMLVLLVEDDPASRYVAHRLLESLGCEVVTAVDGREALERLERGRYDLVLMDCQMPYLDGLEVTRRFRASEPPDRHTPIVALTAYAFDDDRDRMLASGMDGHEAKPIGRERFEGLLRRYAVPGP
jgi:signal transduction histidine kinase/CheY-like chemotaxis protein